MKKILGLLIIILLISSCKKDIVLSQNEIKLIDKISKNETLIDKDNSKLYHQLKDSLTIDKLVFLTEHKNPNIRCLAFSVLAEENYPEIQDIFFDHVNDSIEYVYSDGICGKSGIRVNHYMLLELYPTSGCKYRFNQKEFNPLLEKYSDY